MFLSETWLTKEDIVHIKGFDIIRKDRGGRTGGGVAIIIKNGLKYRRMKNVYICERKLEVRAISVYVNEKYLIIGEFNARHPLWETKEETCLTP
jgi:hypothetical protein